MSCLLLWCHAWSLQLEYLSPVPQSTHCCTTDQFSGYKESSFCSLTYSPPVIHFSVSILSRLGMVSLLSISVCFFLFVCFFVVVSFWFGLMLFVQGFFPPEIPIFSPDFALLVFLLLWYLDSITPACALALYPLQLLFRYLGLDRWRSFSGTHVTCSIN